MFCDQARSCRVPCPMSPPLQDRWCVLISITIAGVRVPVCNFSLCPMYKCTVCRRWRCGDCEGWLRVAHVSSGGMWQGWWSPDTGDNVLADRPHQYTSQSPVCNMHTATDTQTDRQNYRSTSIAFHESSMICKLKLRKTTMFYIYC